MAKAKKGDWVSIAFTATLQDGSLFDTTRDEDNCGCGDDECETGPMELRIGDYEFFPSVEDALVGMSPGEKKRVFIPAAEAFGEYEAEKVFTVDRDWLPDDLVPEIGLELELEDEEGEPELVKIIEINGDSLTLDANHPLIGQDLTYDIELVSID